MAIVLANADGTVYHRYGGRDHISPMNMSSLVELMGEGLKTHRDYLKDPNPPEPKPAQPLSELINVRLQGRIKPVFGCFHCHYAREARQYLALEAGQWTPDQFWLWPLPKQIGLVMNQTRQFQVDAVVPESPAEQSGIRKGDELRSLGGKRILTKYDIQWILDQTPNQSARLAFSLLRNQRPLNGELQLKPGWKVGDPSDYQWRVRNVFTEHMLKFLPAPGFTGERLKPRAIENLGLPAGRFALRVTQLNYGTYLAGIRLGDVIVSAGDKSEFQALPDFYRWCEQLRRAGRDIKMRLLRQDSLMSVMVSQNHLNYSRVEMAPRVALGFIVQELPGDAGLRVGNVTDNCSAEKTGIRIGDRIVSVDGRGVRTRDSLASILNGKLPGDVLTMQVTRNGELLQFGFALPGADENKSDLARLSGDVAEKGQELTCSVSMKVPPGWHIYSVHRKGFGMPTQLEFRGRGYQLVGAIQEPQPKKLDQEGLEPMWILEGSVEFRQIIRVTSPSDFQLVLRVYAQVCDDQSCHEFLSAIANHGSNQVFTEFRGHFEGLPLVESLEE